MDSSSQGICCNIADWSVHCVICRNYRRRNVQAIERRGGGNVGAQDEHEGNIGGCWQPVGVLDCAVGRRSGRHKHIHGAVVGPAVDQVLRLHITQESAKFSTQDVSLANRIYPMQHAFYRGSGGCSVDHF